MTDKQPAAEIVRDILLKIGVTIHYKTGYLIIPGQSDDPSDRIWLCALNADETEAWYEFTDGSQRDYADSEYEG